MCYTKKNSQKEEWLGRSCGGFSKKVHCVTDALGNPLEFIVTGGEVSDCTQFEELTKNIEFDSVLADKGYDTDEIIKSVIDTNSIAVIPPKRNRIHKREYDFHTYKERHKIENLFGWMKYYRRLFARFDKLKKNFIGFIHFVGALIWLR